MVFVFFHMERPEKLSCVWEETVTVLGVRKRQSLLQGSVVEMEKLQQNCISNVTHPE